MTIYYHGWKYDKNIPLSIFLKRSVLTKKENINHTWAIKNIFYVIFPCSLIFNMANRAVRRSGYNIWISYNTMIVDINQNIQYINLFDKYDTTVLVIVKMTPFVFDYILYDFSNKVSKFSNMCHPVDLRSNICHQTILIWCPSLHMATYLYITIATIWFTIHCLIFRITYLKGNDYQMYL